MNPRYAMTYMRGPMTRVEIRKARGIQDPVRNETPNREAVVSRPTLAQLAGLFVAISECELSPSQFDG